MSYSLSLIHSIYKIKSMVLKKKGSFNKKKKNEMKNAI